MAGRISVAASTAAAEPSSRPSRRATVPTSPAARRPTGPSSAWPLALSLAWLSRSPLSALNRSTVTREPVWPGVTLPASTYRPPALRARDRRSASARSRQPLPLGTMSPASVAWKPGIQSISSAKSSCARGVPAAAGSVSPSSGSTTISTGAPATRGWGRVRRRPAKATAAAASRIAVVRRDRFGAGAAGIVSVVQPPGARSSSARASASVCR